MSLFLSLSLFFLSLSLCAFSFSNLWRKSIAFRSELSNSSSLSFCRRAIIFFASWTLSSAVLGTVSRGARSALPCLLSAVVVTDSPSLFPLFPLGSLTPLSPLEFPGDSPLLRSFSSESLSASVVLFSNDESVIDERLWSGPDVEIRVSVNDPPDSGTVDPSGGPNPSLDFSFSSFSSSGASTKAQKENFSEQAFNNRNCNLGISRAPLKGQANQGTSLFTSAVMNKQ